MLTLNTRIWSTENLHGDHETPLHLSSLECGVQCLAVGLLGSFFFFENTMDSERYIGSSMNSSDISLKRKLPKRGYKTAQLVTVQYGRQCASYPCCSEIESFLKDYGPHDLRTCHYQILYVWFCIKDNAYRNNPRNLDKLKTNISNIIAEISPMMLQAVSANMFRPAGSCIQNAGAHF
jgi:hypothetical protein